VFTPVILSPVLAKDLRNVSDINAASWLFGRGFSPKSHSNARKFEASREVLRQKMAQDDKQKGFELMEKGTAA